MITDKEYQFKNLERIFTDGALSPAFKRNPKYPIGGGVARIAYGDVTDFKYVIRNCKDLSDEYNYFWSEDTDIIAEYKSIEDLVDDGWRLD